MQNSTDKNQQTIQQIISSYKNKTPEIVFEWQDPFSTAKGWVVINSLRGGAAGGGTRMRSGVTKDEVLALAKTMEIKFTVSGPNIGGAKSGIDFDEKSPQKYEVLERWYKAITPLLKNYYGTGGDLNVSDDDCITITGKFGVRDPQEGIVVGHGLHFHDSILKQLFDGVKLQILDSELAPKTDGSYKINDMITGHGVVESIVAYYKEFESTASLKDKKVSVQGWGAVGAATGYYLAKKGARVVAISDKDGTLKKAEGLSEQEITDLFIAKTSEGEFIHTKKSTNNEEIYDVEADIFLPCANSGLVKKEHLEKMKANGIKLISSGANIPFDGQFTKGKGVDLYNDVVEFADKNFILIPDFIANCGMAHTFAYLMKYRADVRDSSIFNSVSKTISHAIHEIKNDSSNLPFTEKALRIAVNKLGY